MGESAGISNSVTNRRWVLGLSGPSSAACQIHLAAPKSASSAAAFSSRAASKPTHWAFQSEGSSRPTVQKAGALHAEGWSPPSQSRTFQTALWPLLSGAPA